MPELSTSVRYIKGIGVQKILSLFSRACAWQTMLA